MNVGGYKSLKAARKRFRKGKGPTRILVLNEQGLPIMQVSDNDDFDVIVDDEECGDVVELARCVYNAIKSLRGQDPSRIAFFFNDEIITVERDGPFILLVHWDQGAFTSNADSEIYINRLEKTLHEELS